MIFMNIAPMKKRLYPSICCFFFWKSSFLLASFADQIKFMKCGHVQQISFNKIHEHFAVQQFLYPCKRCFPLWKSLFFVASPPDEIHEIFAIQNILYPCKRCFLVWKSPFSVASPPMKFMNKWPAQREHFLRYMLFFFQNY